MSPAKNLKVKDIAGKYGMSPKDVIRELNEQGFDDVKSAGHTSQHMRNHVLIIQSRKRPQKGHNVVKRFRSFHQNKLSKVGKTLGNE